MSRFSRTGQSFSKYSRSVLRSKDKMTLILISFLISIVLFSYVFYTNHEKEIHNYLSDFNWYQVWDIIQKENDLQKKYGPDETFLPDTR